MKKRILSVFAAAAVLFGSVPAACAADAAMLSPRAIVELGDDGYLRGFDGIPTANDVTAQFDSENVSIITSADVEIAGDATVPSDSAVKIDDTEVAKVLTYGDANRDGKINLGDASSALKIIAKWNIDACTAAADVNGDGNVNLADVTLMLKYSAKWDVTLGKPAFIDITDGYKLLANDSEIDEQIVSKVKEFAGIDLEVITEAAPGDKFITVGRNLHEKYDFIDSEAVVALPVGPDVSTDGLYIDTYGGNVYLTTNEEGNLDTAIQFLLMNMDGSTVIDIYRGYCGTVNNMNESGVKYQRAVRNILKTEPAVDGTNGMNEDIYIAISNATYTSPKNIIYMIGDGMGKNIVTAAEYCRKSELYGGKLAINYLPNEGRQSTYSTSEQITDSAAGGTALSTGYKTVNGIIAKNGDLTENYRTLLELAAEKGKSTGVVATKCVTDATPATFTAHVDDRSMETEIAGQQLQKLTDGSLDVILGGGIAHYDDAANAEALAAATAAGVTYTNDWDTAVASSTPLAGIFSEHEMATTADADEPHVAAMTDLALDLLSEDEDGFFLMVEGSKIDTYGHNNDFGTQVDETFEFDCAVAVALRYVALNPDTALIITADHETGELAIPAEPTVDNIRGSSTRYSSGAHHWIDVPVYAIGYGTEALACCQENTDVAIFIAGLMGEKNFGQKSEVHTLFDMTDKGNTDALLKLNEKNSDGITVTDDGVQVSYGNGIQYLYLPMDEIDVEDSVLDTVTVVRVTYTNMNSKPRLLPFFGVKNNDDNMYMAGERITYLAPGETMTYTYTLSAEWRHYGSLSNAKEFIIYSTAGYKADMLISDISIVTRPLDK